MAWRPGGDGRVCRIVDGTDGKQEESSADHLEVKLEQNKPRSKTLPTDRVSDLTVKSTELLVYKYKYKLKERGGKTWSTAPLKFEIPAPGKVTNIPAVAFSPSTL